MDAKEHREHGSKFDDEVSLLDFIISTKKGLSYLYKHWLLFTLCIALSVTTIFFWNSQKETTYTAPLTLMLNDDGGSQVSGLSGILGQFGIPLSSGKYNIDKLLEISRSRRIIQDVLFQKIEINGSIDFIANHIINLYNLNSKWSNSKEEFKSFLFNSSNVSSFTQTENFALKSIYSLIVGRESSDGLLKLDYGREHYIMTYSLTSVSDTLSVEFIKRHFETVKSFYIQMAVEKQQVTYDLISSKRDSIYANLLKIESMMSRLRDQGLGNYSNQYSSKVSELNTQSLIMKTALGKAEENLAIAQLALENKTPLIQIIDVPIYPISPNGSLIIKNIVFGIIIGVLVASCFLFIFFVRNIET